MNHILPKAFIVGVATALAGLATNANAQSTEIPQPRIRLVRTVPYQANGRQWIRYELTVVNWQAFPDYLFRWRHNGVNPSRAHVSIRNEGGKYIYGFTAFSRAQDLQHLWFAVEVGKVAPKAIYVEIFDQVQGFKFRSNLIRLRPLER